MKNKDMKKISLALVALLIVGSTIGYWARENTNSQVHIDANVQKDMKATSEEDIALFISGVDDYSVLKDTTSFKLEYFIKADKNIIKGVTIDTSAVNYNEVGTYDIIFMFVVNDDAYSAYIADKTGFKADFVDVVILDKITDKDTVVQVKRTITVVNQEEVDKLTTNITTNSDNSSTNKPSGSTTNTNKPGTTIDSHTHNWQPITTTKHHDAEYETVTVVDKEAWDEAIYENRPIYEKYYVYHCNGCGFETESETKWKSHIENAIDWETMATTHNTSYSVVTKERPTGKYEKVQTGTKHHDAVTHTEQKLVKEAWDETITTGYKCSCGQTK